MRQCPSVEGSASPLITHRIGVDVCMARQRTFFHKCHRCIYRGKAANWEPEPAPAGLIDVPLAAEAAEAARAGVPPLEVIVEAQKRPARAKSARRDAEEPAAEVAAAMRAGA